MRCASDFGSKPVIMIKRICGPIYAHVIASLMVPAVALASMGDRALAVEMPKYFQGTWCTDSDITLKHWGGYNPDGADCPDLSVEITPRR
jgi:hypothetical protein